MNEKEKEPSSTTSAMWGWTSYIFAGAVAGFVTGVITLLVASVWYGHSLGLTAGSCAALGCVVTLLLSQPAGLAGMLVGVVAGAIAGAAVRHARHSPR
jgi:hypothetical protein